MLKILEETGTDKGFVISQKGFRSDALEAAKMSNARLLTYVFWQFSWYFLLRAIIETP